MLLIATGGSEALAALESRMGMPFAAVRSGKAYWSEKASASGPTRIFSLTGSQEAALGAIAGPLGSEKLRLSIGAADTRGYRLAGPGAGIEGVKPGIRQLPPSVSEKLIAMMQRTA